MEFYPGDMVKCTGTITFDDVTHTKDIKYEVTEENVSHFNDPKYNKYYRLFGSLNTKFN